MSKRDRPRVSVVIAAYNAEPFLSRAVDSALRQTLTDLEVLVIDDCSSDGTLAAAQAMATADPRVRPLQTPRNGGPSAARNVGLENARGDWIAVLDADDAFLEDRLEALVRLGEGSAADIVADNFAYYDAVQGRRLGAALAESDAVETLTLHRYLSAAKPFAPEADHGLLKPVFRAQFLRDTGIRYPLDSRHGEDFLLIIECLGRGAKYLLSRRPRYLYTLRNSGHSRTVIDYGAVIAQSAALRGRPEIAVDAAAVELLDRRIASIRRLSAERTLHYLIGERDLIGIGGLCLTNPHALPAAVRWAVRKGRGSAAAATHGA